MKALLFLAVISTSAMSFATEEKPAPAVGMGIVSCSDYMAALNGPDKENSASNYTSWFSGYAYALRDTKKVDQEQYEKMLKASVSPYASSLRSYCTIHGDDLLVDAFGAITR